MPRAPRLSDAVEQMLLEMIVSRGLSPGDRLPSERELGEQCGVSRTVIREAVRSLVAKGVIEVISGRGLSVANVDTTSVSASMSLLVRVSSNLTHEHVHDVRTLLEVAIAGLAAENATEDEIEHLVEVCEELPRAAAEDIDAAAAADVEFHRVLARLTHNPLYLIMLDSIGDVMLEIRRRTMVATGPPSVGYEAHKRIVDRIVARDAEGARRQMEQHLQRSLAELQALDGDQ